MSLEWVIVMIVTVTSIGIAFGVVLVNLLAPFFDPDWTSYSNPDEYDRKNNLTEEQQ